VAAKTGRNLGLESWRRKWRGEMANLAWPGLASALSAKIETSCNVGAKRYGEAAMAMAAMAKTGNAAAQKHHGGGGDLFHAMAAWRCWHERSEIQSAFEA
jgi:hypothetical protein